MCVFYHCNHKLLCDFVWVYVCPSRQFGIEDEFFIQLFMSFDENLRLPTMKMLLKQMFDESELSLTKVPDHNPLCVCVCVCS